MASDWTKSSYSDGGNSNCVECRSSSMFAQVRDTQNRHLGYLEFSSSEWSLFLRSVKASAFSEKA
ncbi:DUF397 domain-containing protein [Nocardiopsis sp. CNT-189]|uniref:DUF397 domain-containing protein n=1 Tax=Nocardiopsis oceanisediminis TaxID=2816862 RepID=UPI003B3AD9F9